MKKMKIEKQLIFADHVKRIVSLQVQENLTYRHEEDGIRAIGPLFIKGTYEGDDGIEAFQETLEMDVLAPKDKLSKEAFELQVGEYQGVIHEDSIQVMITMDIYGLKEEEQNKQRREPKREPIPTPVVQEVQPSPQPDPTIQATPKPAKINKESFVHVEEIPLEPAPQEEASQPSAVDDFEDLFEDAQSTYTSYRIIVAKPNDTYAAIANRYEVDETALRETNKNKEILAKTLVILPFQQK